MSLFRIYSDDRRYLNFVIPMAEVINKLGEEHPIHLQRSPKSYQAMWDDTFKLDFYYGKYNKGKVMPDLAENYGRMYFSETAYQHLHLLVESCGEFLPVQHQHGKGYIFNPLKTAEDVDGINQRLVTYDPYDNLESFGFHEDKLKDFVLFRTKLDTYLGIFCQEAFKNAVQANKLTGIKFGPDVSNPIGESYGTLQ